LHIATYALRLFASLVFVVTFALALLATGILLLALLAVAALVASHLASIGFARVLRAGTAALGGLAVSRTVLILMFLIHGLPP
jgi:hypothetical protein